MSVSKFFLCRSFLVASLALVWCSLSVPATATETVQLYGGTFTGSTSLAASLVTAGFDVANLSPTELADLDVEEGRLLIIAGDESVAPASRRPISEYLAAGGSVIVAGQNAFDYTPVPENSVALLRFDNGGFTYSVVQNPPAPDGLGTTRFQQAVQSTVTGPDSLSARQFASATKGMWETMVEVSATSVRSSSRSVLSFYARGNEYMDLLCIEITDDNDDTWINFVPLTSEWQLHSVSLADFLPQAWQPAASPNQFAQHPLLDPNTIDTIALGTKKRTVWREKPMTFALGSMDLAEDASGFYAPTSALLSLRLPYWEFRDDLTSDAQKTKLPLSLFDPFDRAAAVTGATAVIRRDAPPFSQGETLAIESLGSTWYCPPPFLDHPGARTGTDTQSEYSTKEERAMRRIPIWEAIDGAGHAIGNVAELRILTGGPLAWSCVGLFGFTPSSILAEPKLQESLVQAASYVLTSPKVAQVTINTTVQTGSAAIQPTVKVTIQNPLPSIANGTWSVDVGDGAVQGTITVAIPARGTATRTITLDAVPADFPLEKFDWSVTFSGAQGSDTLEDKADVERALVHAIRHLKNAQSKYPDGRYSHHYFGDAYGMRAMLGYVDYLKSHPTHSALNADLWDTISQEEIRDSAYAFGDMLVSRQSVAGELPMGYGENTNNYNVADGGQIALGIGQIAALVDDPARRAQYVELSRKFTDWAETFYIDAALSAELLDEIANEELDAATIEATAGHYGLGMVGTTRQRHGPSWVLADLLGVQSLMSYISSDPTYRTIIDRNVDFYVDEDYSAEGYYQAEALIWAWLGTTDPTIQAKVVAHLDGSFLPALFDGTENDMYQLGGRGTLRALPLLYYRRFIGDTESIRAVLLKYVWSFASESSSNSMRALAEAYPKATHGESLAAAKYAALSSLWALELLNPGATLPAMNTFPRASVITATQERFHLYLLAGQSNMAGRGVVDSSDEEIQPGILTLNYAGDWEPAKDPLHSWYPNTANEGLPYPNAGVGPGFAFAKVMAAAHPDVVIGLIPAAVSGTRVSQWLPDYVPSSENFVHNYDVAVARAQLARQRGTLKGVLWRQGESDTRVSTEEPDYPANYLDRVTEVFEGFRTEFENPRLPIVVGGLPNFLAAAPSDPKLAADVNLVNASLKEVAAAMGAAAYVPAAEYGPRVTTISPSGNDWLHFNAAEQRENGRLLGHAMLMLERLSIEAEVVAP